MFVVAEKLGVLAEALPKVKRQLKAVVVWGSASSLSEKSLEVSLGEGVGVGVGVLWGGS